MSEQWPVVKIGSILKLQRRWLTVDPMEEYGEIGVRSYGRGIFHKPPVSGASLGNKRVLRIFPGDLVFMNVFAWEGAVAVAGLKEEGKIGSHRFATYTPSNGAVDPRFLNLYFQTKAGRELLGRVSPGSAGRNRTMNLAALAEQFIPLPAIEEQRRVLGHIELLASKVSVAQAMAKARVQEAAAIFDSALNSIWSIQSRWHRRPIAELAFTVEGQVDPRIEPYSRLPHINGEYIESGTCRLLSGYRTAEEDGVRSGKFHFTPKTVLYSKIRPYLRKATFVEFEGVCSADVYAFSRMSPDIDPRFFAYSLISPSFTTYANELSGRTRMPKLNQKQMFRYELPYPSVTDQRQIVTYLNGLSAKLAAVHKQHAATDAELQALVPSTLDLAFRGVN